MAARTNLLPNPSHENGSGVWSTDSLPTSSTTYPSDGGYVGTRYARRTLTAASSSIGGGIRYQYDTDLIVGQPYTFSVYLRFDVAQRIRTSISAIGSGNAPHVGQDFDIPANTWYRVHHTTTVPNVATTSLRFVCAAASGGYGHTWQIGNTIDTDAGMIEATDILGTYFDGDTPDAGLLTYSWTGTANNSPSITGSVTLPEQDIPDPYGKVFANNSKANMVVTYRSGWLG